MALPIDVAALNAMIQAAIAADRAANPPMAPEAVVVAPAPILTPFSLTPAGVGAVPWDLQSSQGMKLYISATEAILPLYDGDHGKLNEFLRKISNRAEQFSFASILMVPDNDGINRDITREFGCVTMNNMRAKALLYQGVEVRDYQAAEMLRMLVSSSIEAAVVDQLHYRSSNYTVNIAAAGNPPVMKQDGPCMLHDLIAMVSVETKATISQLTTQLYNLQPLMEEEKSNILNFNKRIQDIKFALRARRAPVPDLLITLLAGYKSCDDSEFVEFIKRQQNDFKENPNSTLTSDQLMQMALEKYKTIVSKGEWLQKTSKELDFIAMKTEIKQLRQNALKPKTPSKTVAKTKTVAAKENRNTGKYAWKALAPKTGESHEKTVEGKDYIFCPHHGSTKWVLKVNLQGIEHKSGCRMMAEAAKTVHVVNIATADAKLMAAVANVTVDMEDEEI
jgi:hypothetical protein